MFLPKSISRIAAIKIVFMNHYVDGNNILDTMSMFHKSYIIDDQLFIEEDETANIDTKYLNFIIKGINSYKHELENIILPHLIVTDINKLETTIYSILMCAAFEIKYVDSVPNRVVINEYINIAKLFLLQNGVPFINAVLDKISK